jgi:hypothetical protein
LIALTQIESMPSNFLVARKSGAVFCVSGSMSTSTVSSAPHGPSTHPRRSCIASSRSPEKKHDQSPASDGTLRSTFSQASASTISIAESDGNAWSSTTRPTISPFGPLHRPKSTCTQSGSALIPGAS